MSLIANILSKFDDSGIKKALKGFGGLKKTVGAIGIGIGFKVITDQLLEATKAASADQKSMQLLTSQLQKATGATNKQITANEKFLSQLSMQVGIADDDLRPAMAGFARVTGSVTKAQDLLKLALDGSAAKGKPLKTVSDALSKAYAGNTTQLVRMFPNLKKSKDIMADYAKIVQGEAVSQADPFSRLNTAMGELQEKLGGIILPYVTEFIDQMMKPGGAIDQVGKFLEDIANPKTDAGKTFIEIKDAIGQTIQGVKDFFALFGGGDAMEGFKNVATTLVKALPALLALKAIMVLANSGKAIANLITAMTAIAAGNAGSPISKFTKSPIIAGAKVLVPVAITAGALESIDEGFSKPANREALANQAKSKFSAYNPGMDKGLFVSKDGKDSSGNVVNNVTINVQGADPKAVVNAWVKYSKQNGGVPNYLKPKG